MAFWKTRLQAADFMLNGKDESLRLHFRKHAPEEREYDYWGGQEGEDKVRHFFVVRGYPQLSIVGQHYMLGDVTTSSSDDDIEAQTGIVDTILKIASHQFTFELDEASGQQEKERVAKELAALAELSEEDVIRRNEEFEKDLVKQSLTATALGEIEPGVRSVRAQANAP
jgi:hypothetical protein